MSAIRWEEPPPVVNRNGTGNTKFRWFADALRERPGEWARYPKDYENRNTAAKVCGSIKTAHVAFWGPPGSFEAVLRDGVIYVRFVGGAT